MALRGTACRRSLVSISVGASKFRVLPLLCEPSHHKVQRLHLVPQCYFQVDILPWSQGQMWLWVHMPKALLLGGRPVKGL